MEEFLWINSQDASRTLTARSAREQKTIRSFVQRNHLPYSENVKVEKPALSSGTGSELADDKHSKVEHKGRSLKSTSKSRQAAMQASWRLGRPNPPTISAEYARRLLPKETLGHITGAVHNARVITDSYSSRYWIHPGPGLEHGLERAREESRMDSEDDIRLGEFPDIA